MDGARKHDYQHVKTPSLLASNSIQAVRQVTHAAFQIYGPQCHYIDAVKKLQELEGVSFPIATLVLASYDPHNIPYFTEGAYRYIRAEEAEAGTWDRKIDFIMKQYRVLVERVAQLRGRMKAESGTEATAVDIEKVGRQINEWAVERRKKLFPRGCEQVEDDFLLKPLGTWTTKKRKLDPPLREEERMRKHPPPKKAAKGTELNGSPAAIGSPVSDGVPYPNHPNGTTPTTKPTIPRAFKPDKQQYDDGRWRPAF